MSNHNDTEKNVPTTQTTKAWHDRAAGDLSSWADGYNPRSERAAAVWTACRDDLEPLISAAPAAGVTEARRIASAVLELLAWAMPLVNDLDAALSEDSLQRFIRANPTGLGDGALGNIRGRVRRVLKARITVTDAPPVTEPTSNVEDSETDDRQAPTPNEPAPASSAAAVYDDETWAVLGVAAREDVVLAASLARPDDVSAGEWAHAHGVATKLGVNLTKAQVRRTHHVHALSHPMRQSLDGTLRSLGATRRTATEVAPLLPPIDEASYRAILREEGPESIPGPGGAAAVVDDCTGAGRRHGGGHLDPVAGVEGPVHPTPGGSPIVSAVPQPAPHSDHPGTGASTPTPQLRRRKTSARQMRLALAAANAERETRAASLPQSMKTFIRTEYVPLEPVRQQWAHLKEAVEATLAASQVRGDDSMRKHVTHLAYFFHWAYTVELPLLPSTLTRAHVARYENEVLVGVGRATRQTRRSRLMAMADQIHPDEAPVKGPPLAHRTVAPPYSLAEMAVIRRVARVQPSDLLVRQMCLLVGLGAGAGIDSSDLKRLRGDDVIDHGPETGIEVHVTNLRRTKDNTENRHHRTVWVLREYEDLVRIGIQGAKRGRLLLGRDAERANVAAAVFSRAVLSKEVPDLAQARLRSTWLATHLQRTTPLHVLLQAAGLTTARSLVELMEHLPAEGDVRGMR
ncbi:hypothetical protein [Nocardioides ferulae]|uniref:hypothetical protein n=1 Tax=Nocardioides ferulae TaxID=2340821 RepID=UPI000F8817FE|nr:hypothetical protein [Nocardioides ferulae]